jgi:hypothetical protein
VAPPWRRKGLGRQAACALLSLHPGCWEIGILAGHLAALAFWTIALQGCSGAWLEQFQPGTVAGWEGYLLVAEVPPNPTLQTDDHLSGRRGRADLVTESLNDSSRLLLSAFDGHPAQRVASTFMELGADGAWNLVIKIPSPTGDCRRNVSVWIDENGVPSMEFGGWHTHADLWDADPKLGVEKMLYYLERITDGSVQLTAVPVGPEGIPFCVLDLEDAQEVLDELTYPGSLSEISLLSWSGGEDETLAIDSGQRWRRPPG